MKVLFHHLLQHTAELVHLVFLSFTDIFGDTAPDMGSKEELVETVQCIGNGILLHHNDKTVGVVFHHFFNASNLPLHRFQPGEKDLPFSVRPKGMAAFAAFLFFFFAN